MNYGEAHISDLDLNEEHGVVEIPHIPTIRISTPVIDEYGENIGFLIASINTSDELSSIDEAFGLGYGMLTDHDGNFITHPDTEKEFSKHLETNYNLFDEHPEFAMNLKKHDFLSYNDVDLQEHRIWTKIHYDEKNNQKFWVLTNVIPDSVLFEDLFRVEKNAMFFVIASMTTTMFLIVFLTRTVTLPIIDMTKAVKNIEQGKKYKLPERGVEEFVTLAKGINHMSESITQFRFLTKDYQNELEQESKHSKDLKYALDESSIIAITDKDGTIREVNRKFEEISKYSSDELIGKNHRILKSGYHPPEFYSGIWDTITKGDVWRGNIKNRTKDGSYYWVKTTIIPILGKDGRPIQFIAIRTDITKQKEIEMKLKDALNNIKKNEIMKSEFASMITHELKTPLTPIRGYCAMLEEQEFGTLNDEQIKFVKTIDSNVKRLEVLIGDVLDAQKLDMNKMQFNKTSVDVKKFLNKIKRDYEFMMIEKEINFSIKNKINAEVNTDEVRLRQVFDNILRNAIDFVLNKGIIDVGIQEKKDQLIFYVKDNGCGIPEEHQSHIFQKFYQVDTSATRKHGGTGLGLVVCKGIINGLGGDIWVESKIGEGTTFFFSIPTSVITIPEVP